MYKDIETYKEGYLKVGGGHKLHYELSGNPKGKSVLFLHGGPGGGVREKDKYFFNPEKFKLITFDQRGAKKSRPKGSLKNNKTKYLVKDINKLLDHLDIDKTILFGGSWGSTLSLIYALQNKKRVKSMVLRGIYLPSKKENDYFLYKAKDMFPKQWENFMNLVPEKNQNNVIQYFNKKIKTNNQTISEKYAKAWVEYELSISKLKYNKSKIKEKIEKFDYKSFALIATHYLMNNCFIPEGYILENANKLNMKVSIVHGRYDCVCSPLNAHKLNKKLPNSNLYFTLGGHSSSNKNTKKRLKMEMDKLS